MKVAQSHPALCDPMDYTIYGILQARTLGWVATPFSWESSQPRDQTQVFRIAGGFFTSWATRKKEESRQSDRTVIQAGIMDYYSPPGGLQGYCTKPMTPNPKDSDPGKDWGQEEKVATEDKMVGWHHWLNGHEFAQIQEDSEGQGNPECCSPWDPKE